MAPSNKRAGTPCSAVDAAASGSAAPTANRRQSAPNHTRKLQEPRGWHAARGGIVAHCMALWGDRASAPCPCLFTDCVDEPNTNITLSWTADDRLCKPALEMRGIGGAGARAAVSTIQAVRPREHPAHPSRARHACRSST